MVTYKEYTAFDQQVHEWLDRNKKDGKVFTKKQIPPVITISREWGAEGSTISYKLQENLGESWRVWDKQIIGEIAKRAEVRNEVVKSIEEKSYSKIESFFRGFFTGESLNQSKYRRHMTNVLLALGHHGYAIILGRAANFVLPQAFRVRIVASRKFRIQGMQKKEKISEEEALFLMRQSDHERSDFVKQLYNADVNAPWNYDLCLKMNYIKPETAVDMIIQGAKDKLGKLTP